MKTADGIEITEGMTVYSTDLWEYVVADDPDPIEISDTHHIVAYDHDGVSCRIAANESYAGKAAAALAGVVAARDRIGRVQGKLKLAHEQLAEAIDLLVLVSNPAALATETA